MRKLLLLLAFLLSVPAWAQRPLPADGKRAEIGAPQVLPMVLIGGELRRLAPGGIIFDAANRRITHGQLLPGMEILYVPDRNGDVQRIIVLTPEEQARLDRAR
jgi:hypothetical protein